MNAHPQFLILSVTARNGCQFGSYDLWQAIVATGMVFGEKNLFHYYDTTNRFDAIPQKTTLFSLASATPSGEFNLDRMGDFYCSGLILFMHLTVKHPQKVFSLMLKTAEQLVEDLEGELCAEPHTPWNESLLKQYHEKLMMVSI